MKLTTLFKTIDWTLLVSPLILLSFGIAVIFSLSQNAPRNLAISQGVYALIGIFIMLVLTFTDYRTWKSLSWTLYGLGLLSLLSVLALGQTSFGATRWIDFGVFQFQPSEIMKLFLIITLARALSDKKTFTFREHYNGMQSAQDRQPVK